MTPRPLSQNSTVMRSTVVEGNAHGAQLCPPLELVMHTPKSPTAVMDVRDAASTARKVVVTGDGWAP